MNSESFSCKSSLITVVDYRVMDYSATVSPLPWWCFKIVSIDNKVFRLQIISEK